VAERFWGTVMPKAKALVHAANLSPLFWCEAVNTCVYLHNRTPTAALDGVSPDEYRSGVTPSLDDLRVFGSPCYVVDEKAPKFGPNAKKMVFVGYSANSTAYRCRNPKTARICNTTHCKFDERRDPVWDTTDWKMPEAAIAVGERTVPDLGGDDRGVDSQSGNDGFADDYRGDGRPSSSSRYPSRARNRVDLGPKVYLSGLGFDGEELDDFLYAEESLLGLVHFALNTSISSGADPASLV
jgi:hypothetical protein